MNLFNIVGTIDNPSAYNSLEEGGLGNFLNNILTLLTIGGGLFALFNFIRAGYTYMGAKDDQKKIEDATSMITNSVIGLLIIAASLVIAALVGKLFFGRWDFIINPTVSGPDIPVAK